MKLQETFNAIMDCAEQVVRWLVVWWLMSIAYLIVIGGALILILGGLEALGVSVQYIRGTGFVLLCGVFLVLALVDLVLRLRGKVSLITLIRNASAAQKIASAVETAASYIESAFLLFTKFTLKTLGWILLVLFLGVCTYFIFQGLVALPASVAIIIGALIIANAIRRR